MLTVPVLAMVVVWTFAFSLSSRLVGIVAAVLRRRGVRRSRALGAPIVGAAALLFLLAVGLRPLLLPEWFTSLPLGAQIAAVDVERGSWRPLFGWSFARTRTRIDRDDLTAWAAANELERTYVDTRGYTHFSDEHHPTLFGPYVSARYRGGVLEVDTAPFL